MKQLFFKSTAIATLVIGTTIGTMSCSREDDAKVSQAVTTPSTSLKSTSLKIGEKTSLRARWNQYPTWFVNQSEKPFQVTNGKRVVVSVFNDSHNGEVIVSGLPSSVDPQDLHLSPRSHKVFTFIAESNELVIHIQRLNTYAPGQVSVVVHYEV